VRQEGQRLRGSPVPALIFLGLLLVPALEWVLVGVLAHYLEHPSPTEYLQRVAPFLWLVPSLQPTQNEYSPDVFGVEIHPQKN